MAYMPNKKKSLFLLLLAVIIFYSSFAGARTLEQAKQKIQLRNHTITASQNSIIASSQESIMWRHNDEGQIIAMEQLDDLNSDSF